MINMPFLAYHQYYIQCNSQAVLPGSWPWQVGFGGVGESNGVGRPVKRKGGVTDDIPSGSLC